ncbi:RagB/SusD family nutrient uptake outer membrane protein [Agriterribacter sp.]|uniref:RagB/SusD family nutrient uptake outer membrane protein n=1 Tax=Agriterribacter sp. TaxID=2821509 RepID=UPI002B8CA272|nr:RagB/SusD family nutrient uptake outer membrane protein [Agriterribacter sp.]HRO46836.1 RagB/SusD family nutrient uptake outer membrane protein [Agriterribacter sp.]HRQ18049.1 RagB/SusD family nutrient uptake outer membrane protein [Agriterribacter sp.]
MKFPKFILLVAMTLLFSCSKTLTIEPENRTVPEGYYNSAQRIQQAVIGGYVDLRRALLTNYAWMMYGEARVGDLNVVVPYQEMVASQELMADNRYLAELSDWGYFYDVIRDANDILDIVAQADDEALSTYQGNLFKGEALALKSMAYFYLARIWGAIPSAEKNDFGKRLSSEEAVTQAALWAAEAKELVPWILTNDDGIESVALTAVRFNKTAVTSLLAQEQLWLGKGQDAYDLLSNAFTAGTADSLSGFGLSNGEDRRTDIPAAPLNGSVVRMSLDRLNAIYPTGDARRASMFNISTSENIATLIIKDASVLELLPQREINLLFAEAAWRSQRLEEAKEYLSSAATGATEDYAALTEDTFGAALLLERQRMLVGTGQRVFDLIRFGEVSSYIPGFTEDDVEKGAAYWPLSASSMKGNALSQNSFWSNP